MENTVSSITSPMPANSTIDSETSDAYLLEEFVSEQHEAAFAALVRRHGGLVRGVCRRILMDPAAADDAFQHTFLSLSQHAPSLLESVAPTASLGSWLYRVAVNASLQLKRKARSRRRTESQFAEHRPSAESPAEPWNDVLPVLDEEISALPGQYRSAVVKCHLEGKTQQDAAKELGITYATLRRRLKEARGMLRTRLCQRGFTHNSFLLLPMLGQLLPESASAQTGTSAAASAAHGGTASTVAASSGTTATGTAAPLTFGAKFLALNPVVKTSLASLFLLGAVSGWWLGMSSSSVEGSTSVVETELESPTEESAPQGDRQHPPSAEESSTPRPLHFAYVLENGRVLSPEFENASEALTDLQAKRKPSAELDLLPNPPDVNSRSMLGDIDLGVPLPQDLDLLAQPAAEGLSQNVNEIEVDPSDPNAELLVNGIPKQPTSKNLPQTKPAPLTVDDVMEFLNKEKGRRANQGFHSIPPASTYVLGHSHPNPMPAKTIKVIQLP